MVKNKHSPVSICANQMHKESILKSLTLVLCCAILTNCSGIKTNKNNQKNDSSKSFATMPEWISNPGENCPASRLCAVGEATGMMQAEAKAREELAKIFSTRVTATTTIITESQSQTQSDVVSGNVSQDMGQTIKEVTDQVLEGVEIEKVHSGTESVFAFAVLNKRKAADILASKMTLIDKDIEALYKRGRRADIAKAIKMAKSKSELNQRHEFLVGSKFPAPVSLSQLYAKRRELGVKDIKLQLEFKSFNNKTEIKEIISTQLIGSDYKVVKSGGQFRVSAEVTTEKEYLNVEGFEKNRFQLNVKSFNQSNEKVGALNFSVSAMGRDFEQSYSEALSAMRDYLENHLDELNMD